ncbi:hypothetical protein Cni_G19364 [Canna indica]|uniref:MULE transposase domain-containing protein n=1 Tax=Canna indica TaxID=4628 RepID=A0AAQ3QJN2_9LILI|nr:hypothetical protein Cni_G19364 [Canna indica]
MDFQSKFYIPIARAKWYRVRSYALEKLRGSVEDHYALLGPYLAELRKKNPTSLFNIVCDREFTSAPPVFKRLYIGFDALKKGFLHGCWPIVGFDDCFLKTFLGGQLLSTVGIDGNNQMFPIAWAVVEGENYVSWRWFLGQFFNNLEISQGYGWTFISDQQKAHVSTVCKSDNVTNNISETFNAYILKARSKLIVDMLEEIRRMLMQRMHMKREMVSKWSSDICPNIRRKLEKKPLTGKDTWPTVDTPHVLPPHVKKMPGRLKKVRRREVHEDDSHTSRYSKHGSIIKCQIYFLEGHNRRSYPLRTQGASTHVEEGQISQPNRGRGRRGSGRGGRGRGRGEEIQSSTIHVEAMHRERAMTLQGFSVFTGEET